MRLREWGKGGRVLVDLGGVGGIVGANYDQNTFQESPKEIIK